MYTFDVRLSNTANKSTQWIPIKPGTDLAVVLAMAYHILTNDLLPQEGKDFINMWTNIDATGYADKVAKLTAVLQNPREYLSELRDADASFSSFFTDDDQPAGGYTPAWASSISGVPASTIESIAEEYAANSPGSTIISYRGAVMHFNGTITENAIQMLEGMCGNIDVPGGRVHAVGASWSYSTTYPKPSSSGLSSLSLQNKSAYVAPTHGASHQVLSQIKQAYENDEDVPSIYLVYCYTPAYANGDMQENINILKNTNYIPYLVVSDTSYSEAAMYADLLLPDTTYLERWDWEDMVSNNMIKEYYIRQPVITPLGQVRDLKEVCIELAGRLSTGSGDELQKVADIGSMENFVKAACNDTAAVNDAGVAKGYADGFAFMKAEGAWYDPAAVPAYETYKKGVDLDLTDPGSIADDDETEYIFKDSEGICWETTKADFNEGYRNVKSAYKHYQGQEINGTIYQGFKPDKANKSGYFELDSVILKDKHYPGLPIWMKIPEHESLNADELILTTYKIATQIHSRSQNCKYLTEITHHEPAWINSDTASALGIADGDTVKLTRSKTLYNDKDMTESLRMGTVQTSMEVEVRVTDAIHPSAIAISHHLGHWAYGRYASGNPHPLATSDSEQAAQAATDPDANLIWWNKYGYRGNWIVPNAGDPIGGGQRVFDTVVKVESV
jgi:anaerobic selenocysteine-containing dehydrogenase